MLPFFFNWMSFATKNGYIYVVWELVKRYGDASKKYR